MTTLWTAFLPQVAPKTYAAPEIMQIEEIRNAAIEFCEKSLSWQVTQDPYPLMPGINGVNPAQPFNNDSGAIVHKILAANLQGNGSARVFPQTPEWCDEQYPGWNFGAQLGKPSNVTQTTPDTWTPVPAQAGGPWFLIMRVAYKPTRASTGGPDYLFNDYYEVIASGAIARLCAMPKQEWSNPQLVMAHAMVFDTACDKAKVRAARGFGRGAPRVKAQFV